MGDPWPTHYVKLEDPAVSRREELSQKPTTKYNMPFKVQNMPLNMPVVKARYHGDGVSLKSYMW